MARRKTPKPQSFSNSPFKSLKGLSAFPEKAEADPVAPPVEETPAENGGGEEGSASFADEMDFLGVQPLPGKTLEEPEEERAEPAVKPPEVPAVGSERELFLDALGSMDATFADEFPDDQDDQPRQGAAPRRMRQLARGRLQPAAELDLHGLTVAAAAAKAGFFLEDAVHHGLDCVLLITGKGLHSAEGPVLRRAMEQLLDERRELVAEWGVAPRRLGGDGALAVFLRKRE